MKLEARYCGFPLVIRLSIYDQTSARSSHYQFLSSERANGTFRRSGTTFNRPEKPMKKMPKFKSALDVLRFYYGFWINSESRTSIIKDGTVLWSKMCQRVSGHF
ncbi:hypothetical protein TNCT_310611 [Trichonephila clavata]|uniref:Uncharacterized protein n=1 Tax=Trichonephila clavata TaxID=2740835 RepID=A0A8X6FKH6_TRICU|nr:hypothetical protein TNCT_310611 [Trichonephila clavata]